jgi:hypothetical protein
MRKRYDWRKVDVSYLDENRASWKMAGHTVRGTDSTYRVRDRNFDRLNWWTMVVRVPNERAAGIVVQPLQAPGKKSWAGIERRSIVLVRGTKNRYRGEVYCKVNLADPTQGKTKIGFRRGERDVLPGWFDHLKHRMRLKDTVTTTRGSDGKSQVVVMAPDDHERMIRLFFALKVWVLEEGITFD